MRKLRRRARRGRALLLGLRRAGGGDRGRPREARKVVSALFADVVGSTALGERLDPEDFKDVIGGAIARMATRGRALRRRGVRVLPATACWRCSEPPPPTRTTPSERSSPGSRSSTRSPPKATRSPTEWGIEGLAVRVGIETGLAVLGRVGGGSKLEYGAVGDALNTAARLQAAAEPGTVLVGPADASADRRAVRASASPVELELKGKSERWSRPAAVRTDRPTAPVAAPSARRWSDATPSFAAASSRSRRCSRDRGGSCSSPARRESASRESSPSFAGASYGGGPGEPRWLEGRCVSYGEALPYWPFRGSASRVARRARERARIERCPRRARRRARSASPAIARPSSPRRSTSCSDRGAPAPAIADPPPQVIQERIRAAVAELFAGLARRARWRSRSTTSTGRTPRRCALAERLLELAERAPILIVLGRAPERAPPGMGSFASARSRPSPTARARSRSRRSAAIATANCSRRWSARHASRRARATAARARRGQSVLPRGARALDGRVGSLRRDRRGWSFDREIPVEIPETVEKLIGCPDRPPLPAGAGAARRRRSPRPPVPGRAARSGSAATARPTALDELRSAELLRDGARWPVPFCAFRHTLIQETAYRRLLRRRRQSSTRPRSRRSRRCTRTGSTSSRGWSPTTPTWRATIGGRSTTTAAPATRPRPRVLGRGGDRALRRRPWRPRDRARARPDRAVVREATFARANLLFSRRRARARSRRDFEARSPRLARPATPSSRSTRRLGLVELLALARLRHEPRELIEETVAGLRGGRRRRPRQRARPPRDPVRPPAAPRPGCRGR